MKSIIPFILSVIFSFISCTNQEDNFVIDSKNTESTNDSIFTYNLFLEPNNNDITRVTEDGLWEDNDVIYFNFHGDQNFRIAYAIYNKNNNSWVLYSSFNLAPVTNHNLRSIYYCKGRNPRQSSPFESIWYDYISEIYSSDNARYTVDNDNNVYVNASMSPDGRRIRFKGEVGTQIIVFNTFWYYEYMFVNGLNAYPNISQDKNDYISLIVNENGYTDYVVGFFGLFPRVNNIAIFFPQTGMAYYKPWSNDFLDIGESGCYTLPTDTNLHGWSLSNSETYTYDGHECVDLGLRSGTLWATCNIGANSFTEIGDYYSYGEVQPKSSYSESNYTYYDGNLDNEHDAAYVNWGSSWRMPTRSEQEEFLNNTYSATISINGTKGKMFVGPNGHTIYFPLSGIYHDDKKDNSNFFWSSTSNNNTNAYSMSIDGYEIVVNLKYYGIPIRPVKSPN